MMRPFINLALNAVDTTDTKLLVPQYWTFLYQESMWNCMDPLSPKDLCTTNSYKTMGLPGIKYFCVRNLCKSVGPLVPNIFVYELIQNHGSLW